MDNRIQKKSHAGRLKMAFDLRQLAVFVEVVDRASFSGAARALNMAQASVSERIANLESSLNAQLIDRLGRQVAPTKVGQLLAQRARELLQLRNDTIADLKAFLNVESGEITIGASTTPGAYLLPNLAVQLKAEYPTILLRIQIADSQSVIRMVENGTVELGVVGKRYPNNQLKFTALLKDNLVLACPPSNPLANTTKSVSISELKKQSWVLREPGSSTRALTQRTLLKGFKNFEHTAHITELGSTSAVIEGVKAGLGITLISQRAIQSELSNGTLKTIAAQGLPFSRRLYLVEDKRRTLGPALRIFRKKLIKYCSEQS